jgi:hypothetical protein
MPELFVAVAVNCCVPSFGRVTDLGVIATMVPVTAPDSGTLLFPPAVSVI